MNDPQNIKEKEKNLFGQEFVSIFNDVLGPVTPGPSSSHTAGSYRIGLTARYLLGEVPLKVNFFFDPEGSYIKTYQEQGSNLAFASGLLKWPLTDPRFKTSLITAKKQNLELNFLEACLNEDAVHPNSVRIEMESISGKKLKLLAQSTGGGNFHISRLNEWEVNIFGKQYEVLLEIDKKFEFEIKKSLEHENIQPDFFEKRYRDNKVFIHLKFSEKPNFHWYEVFQRIMGIKKIWETSPVYFTKKGKILFKNAEEMIGYANKNGLSLGQTALEYESELLGMSKNLAMSEMYKRWETMQTSLEKGLTEEGIKMRLLTPTASRILEAEKKRDLPIGGPPTRAAARAMAVMHTSNSMGIICAAPTGGSSGVIPGVLSTLKEEKNLSDEQLIFALFAAGAIGLIVATRATFAAEIAGCQVEIGAAGAMAAAATVEVAEGNAQQAVDAAAISFQNTMGSVCDLVQGLCEIPCHTRNAVAASSAFVCADLILGGYINSIPLDETIDSSLAVGKMLPIELRVTSRGGIATAPSAIALKKNK